MWKQQPNSQQTPGANVSCQKASNASKKEKLAHKEALWLGMANYPHSMAMPAQLKSRPHPCLFHSPFAIRQPIHTFNARKRRQRRFDEWAVTGLEIARQPRDRTGRDATRLSLATLRPEYSGKCQVSKCEACHIIARQTMQQFQQMAYLTNNMRSFAQSL